MRTPEELGTNFDPTSKDLNENFWPTIEWMRQECPVAWSPELGGYWVLTRYSDVWDVARDSETFTSTHGAAGIPLPDGAPQLLPIDTDPPYQKALRRIINPYFTPQRALDLEPGIRAIADELFDGFASQGRCDFTKQFAEPFPAHVFFRLVLGVPVSHLASVAGWLHAIIYDSGHSDSALEDFGAWARSVLDERAAEAEGDTVVDGLVHGEIDGRPLTDEEKAWMLATLIIGGLETGATAYANVALHLAESPELVEQLRRDPDLRDTAVDEFLRYEAPALGLSRWATKDTTVGDQEIKAGDRILCHYGAGNRDPDAFESPDELLLDRHPNRHMSFGVGPHRCVGSHLARLELRVVIDKLLELEDLRLQEDGAIEYKMGLHRTPVAVPLRFKPSSVTASKRLHIDPELCQGHARCAAAVPELFGLNDQGFGVAPDRELSDSELAAAEQAVRGCPEQAIELK